MPLTAILRAGLAPRHRRPVIVYAVVDDALSFAARVPSASLVTTWIREEKLDTILPNEPKITNGKIVAHSDRVLVAV